MSPHLLTGLASVVLMPAVCVGVAGEAGPAKVLEDKGLRRRGSSLYILPDERKLSTALSRRGALTKSRQALDEADDRLRQAEDALERVEDDAEALMERRRRLKEMYDQATRRQTSVNERNRLVGDYNDATDRLNRAGLARERIYTDLDRLREGFGKAREAYLQTLVDVRKLVDGILAQYEAFGKDPDVKAALDAVNGTRTGKKPITLGPSRSFLGNVKKLEKLEAPVRSEDVELRSRDHVWWVDAVINRAHSKPMILDTGAALVIVPHAFAEEVGIRTSPADRSITLKTADGSTVQAKLVRIDSLTVGKFTEEHVECAVLPGGLKRSVPLLGRSFLRRFTYKIDPDSRKLTLQRLQLADEPDKGKAGSGKVEKKRRPSRR